jgi:glycosyltransferase involved in cell wall biosynthesis
VSGARPFVSVVVPTRDRPRFLHWCLAALAAQSFDDFEVVVHDNPTTTPASEVVTALGDPRVRYVRAEQQLSMCDNWEHAVSCARGEYVSVLTDKMALFPSALASLHAAVEQGAPQIVTWWNAAYLPVDEDHDLGPGYFVPTPPPTGPVEYSLRETLEHRLAFDVRRNRVPRNEYVRGKIVFGAFRSDLVATIRDRAGGVFFPIAPDYTSMAAASVLCDRGLDLGRAHVVSFETRVSNGKLQQSNPDHARRFLHETDPTDRILSELPIPGLYTSLHNLVAYDLVSSLERVGATELAACLDRAQLASRAAEDLADISWRGRSVRSARADQRALLAAWVADHGLPSSVIRVAHRHRTRVAARRLLARTGPLERLAYRVLGRSPDRYDSIVEAVTANDVAPALLEGGA